MAGCTSMATASAAAAHNQSGALRAPAPTPCMIATRFKTAAAKAAAQRRSRATPGTPPPRIQRLTSPVGSAVTRHVGSANAHCSGGVRRTVIPVANRSGKPSGPRQTTQADSASRSSRKPASPACAATSKRPPDPGKKRTSFDATSEPAASHDAPKSITAKIALKRPALTAAGLITRPP